MSYFDAIIYGIIQALTEFLPVSSSGHLALLPRFMNFEDPGVFFDLAMHLGTAFAIIISFFKDIIWLIRNKCIFNYIIAPMATASIIFLVKDFAQTQGRQSIVIAVNLIIFGWLLYFSDKQKKNKPADFLKQVYIKESIIIGLAQVLAVFPGVSRSGITITAARMLGFDKKQASSFSFLLSVPIILGGMLIKYKEIGEAQLSFDWTAMIIGILISFVLGLVVIHYFLKLIKKFNFLYFALYRTILAILVIVFIAG